MVKGDTNEIILFFVLNFDMGICLDFDASDLEFPDGCS